MCIWAAAAAELLKVSTNSCSCGRFKNFRRRHIRLSKAKFGIKLPIVTSLGVINNLQEDFFYKTLKNCPGKFPSQCRQASCIHSNIES